MSYQTLRFVILRESSTEESLGSFVGNLLRMTLRSLFRNSSLYRQQPYLQILPRYVAEKQNQNGRSQKDIRDDDAVGEIFFDG